MHAGPVIAKVSSVSLGAQQKSAWRELQTQQSSDQGIGSVFQSALLAIHLEQAGGQPPWVGAGILKKGMTFELW